MADPLDPLTPVVGNNAGLTAEELRDLKGSVNSRFTAEEADTTSKVAVETSARIAADGVLTTAVALNTTHRGSTANPHAVTKTQVGLSDADNTSDPNKPVSTAQATADALNLKITQNLGDLDNVDAAVTNLGLSNAGAVTNFIACQQFYFINVPETTTDMSGVGGTFASVGPTGSGATHIVTELDNIPLAAKFVEVTMFLETQRPNTTATIVIDARRFGTSSTGIENRVAVAIDHVVSSPGDHGVASVTSVKLPLDSANRFELRKTVAGTNYTFEMNVKGFGI